MSTHNAEPSENLSDSVTIPAEDPSDWGGELSTGIDSTEGRVREARLRRQDLQSINQSIVYFVATTTQFQLMSSRKSKNKLLVKKQLEKFR